MPVPVVRLTRRHVGTLCLAVLLALAIALRAITSRCYYDESFARTTDDDGEHASQPRTAIVMPTRPGDNPWRVFAALDNIERAFNRRFKYPIVLLTNDVLPDEAIQRHAALLTEGRARWHLIPPAHWDVPAAALDSGVVRRIEANPPDAGMHSVRYHQLCRWLSGYLHQHPALQEYEWLWRIDSDGRFFCSNAPDPVRRMAATGKQYGFALSDFEMPRTIPSAMATAQTFFAANPSFLANTSEDSLAWLTGHSLHQIGVRHWPYFFNNFEISRRDFWQSEAYTRFFEHLDRAGGFWEERWGDAYVHSLAVAAFMDRDEVAQITEMGYSHSIAPTLICPDRLDCACRVGCKRWRRRWWLSDALSGEEVAKHNSQSSLWVIVHGKAYDLTDFAPEHPGGLGILLKYAGKDSTEAYEPIHPPGTLETYLPKEKHLGEVEMKTVNQVTKIETEEEKTRLQRVKNKPPLSECLSLHDFESIARTVLSSGAWAYYSSGSDDEVTMRENHTAYQRLWFRPRVLRDVTTVDYSTTMLGTKTDLPIYITATALGKLGHPEGETVLTRAAGKHNIIQMIPTLASCSFDEIVDAALAGQTQWMQLYVNKDRGITEKIVRHAEKRGIKGLFITVDAPQLGRREKDMRQKFSDSHGSNVQQGDGSVDRNQGAARAISSFIDPGLSWKDIPWFKSITKMPIILKGVQCWEDAVLAAEQGLAGVVLSNHGGRQLDFARSGIEILVEVVDALKKRNLYNPAKFSVFIDGGVRRAGDVLKAIALGATGVGLGRPFLWAMSSYGVDGVSRAIQILKDEMEMDMRLIGAPTLADVRPDMVDTSQIRAHGVEPLTDHAFARNYEPLPPLRGLAKL